MSNREKNFQKIIERGLPWALVFAEELADLIAEKIPRPPIGRVPVERPIVVKPPEVRVPPPTVVPVPRERVVERPVPTPVTERVERVERIVERPEVPRFFTKTFGPFTDRLIKSVLRVIDTEKAGYLVRFFMKSASNNFSISLTCDEVEMFDKSYSELESMSEYLAGIIDAYEDDDGEYVVVISNYRWLNKATLSVIVEDASLTASYIAAIWEEFKET